MGRHTHTQTHTHTHTAARTQLPTEPLRVEDQDDRTCAWWWSHTHDRWRKKNPQNPQSSEILSRPFLLQPLVRMQRESSGSEFSWEEKKIRVLVFSQQTRQTRTNHRSLQIWCAREKGRPRCPRSVISIRTSIGFHYREGTEDSSRPLCERGRIQRTKNSTESNESLFWKEREPKAET